MGRWLRTNLPVDVFRAGKVSMAALCLSMAEQSTIGVAHTMWSDGVMRYQYSVVQVEGQWYLAGIITTVGLVNTLHTTQGMQ